MYNLKFYKEEKDKILEKCFFTKRQKEVFIGLLEGINIKGLSRMLNCSVRTINYDIKNIKGEIEKYRNGDQKKYFYIYIHIFPNGKKYIGVTENVIRRWGRDGIPYSKNIKMYEDIIKYGWENIEHEILIKTESELEALNLESKLIKLLDLTNDKKGYNKKI